VEVSWQPGSMPLPCAFALGEENLLRLPLRFAGFTGNQLHERHELPLCADAAHRAGLGRRVRLDPMTMANVLNVIRAELNRRPFCEGLSGGDEVLIPVAGVEGLLQLP
jgi:hypothetical protein